MLSILNKKVSVIYLLVTLIIISCNESKLNKPENNIPVIDKVSTNDGIDKSPLDICYFPVNYPVLKMNNTDTSILMARLIYSRPQKNGRLIFGNNQSANTIQAYGAYWRLGANEATEIEFFKPVMIKDKKIDKGRYIIYCIPLQDKWTIVFNNNLFSWGLHPDISKDIAQIEIPVTHTTTSTEFFTMYFEPVAAGANLIMTWDTVKATLPISFIK